jgi:hypothetical protein
MGLSLTLLPFYLGKGTCAQDVLKCDDDSELFESVKEVAKEHGRDVPEEFNSFLSRDGGNDDCPPHYGRTTRDAYGDPLKYVTAKALKPLASSEHIHNENKAVWAYVCALRDDHRIALYWC